MDRSPRHQIEDDAYTAVLGIFDTMTGADEPQQGVLANVFVFSQAGHQRLRPLWLNDDLRLLPSIGVEVVSMVVHCNKAGNGGITCLWRSSPAGLPSEIMLQGLEQRLL